jgi:hypothetical protein
MQNETAEKSRRYALYIWLAAMTMTIATVIHGWPSFYCLAETGIFFSIASLACIAALYMQRWYGRAILVVYLFLGATLCAIGGAIAAVLPWRSSAHVIAVLMGALAALVGIGTMVSWSQGLLPADQPQPGLWMLLVCPAMAVGWYFATLYVALQTRDLIAFYKKKNEPSEIQGSQRSVPRA